jgi:3-deoxy-manno-octulosonate cytidylyltransferase (CMP-KDO synthetase)
MVKTVAIIPARYGSTRFPGKALADILGKTLIHRVYERVSLARSVSSVAVATDDERIAHEVERFGGTVIMTSPFHTSGTDRVREASKTTGGDIIVNVQGDEPLIEPSVIDSVIERCIQDEDIVCSTAAFPVRDSALYHDHDAVKVVCDLSGRALYFSRSPLPFYRDRSFEKAYIHMGIYCFRRQFLDLYSSLKQSPLEETEKLEQLRILEHGFRIGIVITDHGSVGVDTVEDLEKVRRMIQEQDY